MKTIKEIVKELEEKLHCNCDFDTTTLTGHDDRCRIHIAALVVKRELEKENV